MATAQVMEQLVLGNAAVLIDIQDLECQQPAAVAAALSALCPQCRIFFPTQIAVPVQIVHGERRRTQRLPCARRCGQQDDHGQGDEGHEQRAHQRGSFRYATRACMSASERLKPCAGILPECSRADRIGRRLQFAGIGSMTVDAVAFIGRSFPLPGRQTGFRGQRSLCDGLIETAAIPIAGLTARGARIRRDYRPHSSAASRRHCGPVGPCSRA